MSANYGLLKTSVNVLCFLSKARYLVLTDSTGNFLAASRECPNRLAVEFAAAEADPRMEFEQMVRLLPDELLVAGSIEKELAFWAVFDVQIHSDTIQAGIHEVVEAGRYLSSVVTPTRNKPVKRKFNPPPVDDNGGNTPPTAEMRDWIN